MCDDIQTFVDQVQSVLLAIVPQNMLLLVSITKLDNFASNQVADMALCICEGKAIRAHPVTRVDCLLILINKVKCLLKAILKLIVVYLI